jgi:hypothetical protein
MQFNPSYKEAIRRFYCEECQKDIIEEFRKEERDFGFEILQILNENYSR